MKKQSEILEELALELEHGQSIQRECSEDQESTSKSGEQARHAKKQGIKRTTIYLDKKLHKKLRRYCVDHECAMSEVIEKLINEMFNVKYH